MTRWGGGLPEMRLDSDVPGLTNPTLQKCPDICPRGCKKALEAREAEEEEAEEEVVVVAVALQRSRRQFVSLIPHYTLYRFANAPFKQKKVVQQLSWLWL